MGPCHKRLRCFVSSVSNEVMRAIAISAEALSSEFACSLWLWAQRKSDKMTSRILHINGVHNYCCIMHKWSDCRTFCIKEADCGWCLPASKKPIDARRIWLAWHENRFKASGRYTLKHWTKLNGFQNRTLIHTLLKHWTKTKDQSGKWKLNQNKRMLKQKAALWLIQSIKH